MQEKKTLQFKAQLIATDVIKSANKSSNQY